MIALSIVIPCYNEADNLPALVAKCAELIKANADVEIVLVDNGSLDNSPEVITDLLAAVQLPNLRSHRVPVNKGYGYGVLEGLNKAKGKVLCWTHADLQTDIFDCIKAFKIYKQQQIENFVVKGKRSGRKLFDIFFTTAMQGYVLFKLKANVSDINGQPKLFSKTFYDQIKDKAPYDFSLDLFLLINAKRIGKIVDFPVYFHDRVAGEAKGGSGNLRLKIKLMKRSMAYISSLKNNF